MHYYYQRQSKCNGLLCLNLINNNIVSLLTNVPIVILDSILQLSQLTTLLLNDVRFCLEEDVQREQRTRKSYLTNLKVFGFIQDNYLYKPYPEYFLTMRKIAALIVHSASQTLRKLIWCDKTGGE